MRRHQYHKNCIDQWLLEQRTCPICKLDILQAYGLQVPTCPGGGGGGTGSGSGGTGGGGTSPSANVHAQRGSAANAASAPRDVRVYFVIDSYYFFTSFKVYCEHLCQRYEFFNYEEL